MIPKILHQIWVGPHRMPKEWMQTWKDNHPEWEYILWDNKRVSEYNFINKKQIDDCIREGKYHGAADIIKYEALYEYGGFIAPADSISLRAIDELLDIEEDCFCCPDPYAYEYPGLLSPQIGSIKKNKLIKEIIKRIPNKVIEPCNDTGNHLLTNTVKELNYPIKIYPAYYFIPYNPDSRDNRGKEKPYADHKWGTTRNTYPK
jgi:mannosyltransferase OCH1-like enzyme